MVVSPKNVSTQELQINFKNNSKSLHSSNEIRADDFKANSVGLSLWRKCAYAIGGIPMQLTQNIVAFYLPIFILEVVKLPAYYVSIILFVAKGVDAITDPIVGFLVLRTNSRIGRKRPWLICATPVCAISYFLIFYTVPWTSEIWKFVFYALCTIILQIGVTSFHVAYSSMTMVLTDVPSERDTLTAFRMFGEVSAILVGTAIFSPIVESYRLADSCNNISFTITEADINAEINSYMIAAGVTTGVLITSALICFFGTKEISSFEDPVVNYFRIARKVLSYKPYTMLMCSFLCMSLGIQFLQGNLILLITHTLKLVNYTTGAMIAILGTAIVCLPLVQVISLRIGKKLTLAIGMLNLFPTIFSIIFLPENMNLVLFFCLMISAGFSIAIAFLLPWSMLPDVIDAFYIENGVRQEAVFYSMYVFFNKISVGLASAFSLAVLHLVGYNTKQCNQTQQVSDAIRYLSSICPMLFFIPAFICLYLYPLNKLRLLENRKKMLLSSSVYSVYETKE